MKNIFSLKGKNIIITGAAGFFGQYFARGVLDNDAKKLIVIEHPKVGDKFYKELIRKYGKNKIEWHKTDLYNTKEAEKCFEDILKKNKRIDVLVNNAFEFSPRTGFAPGDEGAIHKITHEQLQNAFESGIYWAVLGSQKIGLAMKKQGGGSIINICSMYSIVAPNPLLYEGTNHSPNPPGYTIVKSGLLALTRYCASFMAPVRVNAMLPGAFPNFKEHFKKAGKSYEKDFVPRLVERTLLKRVGYPEDLIGALVFLASDASSYITGHGIVIDGGWTVT